MKTRNIFLIPLVAGSLLAATSHGRVADLEPAADAHAPIPVAAAPAVPATPPTPAVRAVPAAAAAIPATPAAPAPVAHIEHVLVPAPVKPMAPPPPPPHVARVTPDMAEDIDVDENLGEGVLDEERDLNVQKAIKRYQAEMDKFERQCNQAADAAGNLLVSCDKLGQTKVAQAQLERLRKKLEMQLALVTTFQKKSAELVAKSPNVPPKRIAHAPYWVKVNPTGGTKHAEPEEPGEAGFVPDGPGHEEELMEPAMEDGEDSDIRAVKRTWDLSDYVATINKAREKARIDGKLGAEQQAAMRGMQEQLKKLQAEMSSLRDMKSSLRISDEAREKLEDARAELELAKVNLRNAQKQREEARKKCAAVGLSAPERLPSPYDSDAQYSRLRDELTNLMLMAPKESESQTNSGAAINVTLEKLKRYVTDIYLPNLEESRKIADFQADNAFEIMNKAKDQFQAIQREIEKSAAKEGKPPKEKKPAKDAPAHDESGEELQKY